MDTLGDIMKLGVSVCMADLLPEVIAMRLCIAALFFGGLSDKETLERWIIRGGR